jgi:hypothetical protein
MMQYKKWFILLLIPIAVLVIPHISFATTYNFTAANTIYSNVSSPIPAGTYYYNVNPDGMPFNDTGNTPQVVNFTSLGGGWWQLVLTTASTCNNGTYGSCTITNSGAPYVDLAGTSFTTVAPYIPPPIYLSITNPNPSSTIYTDFSNWGFTATGLTTGDSYIYQILYDNAPLSGSDCTINSGELNYLGENNGGGYFDSNSFTASSSTQDLTLSKSGALVDSNATHYTNGINYTSGYPSTLYTEVCLEQNGVGYIQDTTSSIDMSLGATPINASSTNITIVSPSSTSTPVAPFENYIYGVTGVATTTQYTVSQTIVQFINGIPIAPYTQTQTISGANIIAKGLTFQNRNELDNYGNASSVSMAVGVTISNSIGEIGQLEYNYTMLPFQSVGTNASTGLEQIVNPNGTSTLIYNIATGNGTASTTIPYSNKGLSSVCSSPSNILDFGQDADYVGCKINNLINQLTFNVTQNLTDSFNGTYNTFTGIFPIDIFADFNNDISIAQTYSNSTSSNPLVLKGQSIADAITGAPTGQYTFGGYTMPILSATTTSWIQTKSGFDYRGVIDNILYALTGLIMLGGAIGVVVMIHKTTAGNA